MAQTAAVAVWVQVAPCISTAGTSPLRMSLLTITKPEAETLRILLVLVVGLEAEDKREAVAES